MTFRTLNEGRAAGEANMTRDEQLARALGRGEIPPTARIYGWEPPAVSIGYHQSPDDLDREALSAAGIDLVRRPTGGRAILHWNEVTYCAVVPLSLGAPREIYSLINQALLEGIRAMGIPAGLSASGADLRHAYATARGIPCFSFSVASEIQSGGRKLVGSAQRRFGAAVLQHGSFLLGPEHRQLSRFIRSGGPGDAAAEAIAADLELRTTDATTVLGRPVGFAEAAGALAAGFERFFSGLRGTPSFRPDAPSIASIHQQVHP